MWDNLPEAVLKIIFTFVGEAWDFRCLERTCRAFRQALEDDAIWASCEECKPQYETQEYWPTLNREKAFVVRALNHCHYWQRRSDSVVLSVLSVQEWKHLVNQGLQLLSLNDLTGENIVKCCDTFPLRGDTSATLLTIVEDCLQNQLQRANSLAVLAARKGPLVFYQSSPPSFTDYPTVSNGAFHMQDHLMNFQNFATEDNRRGHRGVYVTLAVGPNVPDMAGTISNQLDLCASKRHLIVRRLAYRAGVTMLTNEAFKAIWAQIMHLISMLLEPACIALASRQLDLDNQRQSLRHMDTMRDTPPPPEVAETTCTGCDQPHIIHTIVPAQVEEAAKRLGITKRVYCSQWHVETRCKEYKKKKMLMKEEVAAAQAKYCLDGFEDDDLDSDESSQSDVFPFAPEELSDDEDSLYSYESVEHDSDSDEIDNLFGDLDPDELSEPDVFPLVPQELLSDDEDYLDCVEHDSDLDDTYEQGHTSDEEEFECFEEDGKALVGDLDYGPVFSRELYIPV